MATAKENGYSPTLSHLQDQTGSLFGVEGRGFARNVGWMSPAIITANFGSTSSTTLMACTGFFMASLGSSGRADPTERKKRINKVENKNPIIIARTPSM